MEIPKTLGPVDVEPAEYLKACMPIYRRIYTMLAITIFLFAYLIRRDDDSLIHTFVPSGVACISLFFFYWVSRHRVVKRVDAMKEGLRGLTWTLTADCLVIQSLRSRTELPWREFKKCTLSSDIISLVHLGGLLYFMPTRALSQKEEALEVVTWTQEQIESSKG